jgi:hypothetical protein
MKRKTAVLRLPAHPMTCVQELPVRLMRFSATL